MIGKFSYAVVCSVCFVMANLLVALYSIGLNDSSLHAENALLENFQAACLAVSAVAYLLLVPATQDQRLIFLAIALLCFSFLLRELDLDRLNVPSLVQMLGSGPGRTILLASLWISLTCYALRCIESKPVFMKRLLRSRVFRLLGAAFGLLLASSLMDENFFGIAHSRLFEELLETNAYLLIMLPLVSVPTRLVAACRAGLQ